MAKVDGVKGIRLWKERERERDDNVRQRTEKSIFIYFSNFRRIHRGKPKRNGSQVPCIRTLAYFLSSRFSTREQSVKQFQKHCTYHTLAKRSFFISLDENGRNKCIFHRLREL